MSVYRGISRSTRWLLTLSVALIAALLFPWSAGAQGADNSFAAYVDYAQGENALAAYSPLFRAGANGWDSTIAVHNEMNVPVHVDFRARSFDGVGITAGADIPAQATRIFGGRDLGLPAGFSGSLAATASGEISAVISHGGPGL